MKQFPWPGNGREIRNFMKKLHVTYPPDELDAEKARHLLQKIARSRCPDRLSAAHTPHPREARDWDPRAATRHVLAAAGAFSSLLEMQRDSLCGTDLVGRMARVCLDSMERICRHPETFANWRPTFGSAGSRPSSPPTLLDWKSAPARP